MSSVIEVLLDDGLSTPPEMFGWFFYPIKGFETVQEVSLQDFYNLGKEMRALTLREKTPLGQLTRLVGKHLVLRTFLERTKDVPFPKTQGAITDLLAHLQAVMDEIANRPDINAFDHDAVEIAHEKTKRLIGDFETALDRDVCIGLSVFAVTPKGDKSTRILLENAEAKFPTELLAVMPAKTIEDVQEAGRCLAFERATACAFHICRATEALMLAYYEHLARAPWPPPPMRKDWANYNTQLKAKGAPDRITTRLEEIGRMDRNAYAHPDLTVPLDEAPIVYELCTGVMFFIAKEMK